MVGVDPAFFEGLLGLLAQGLDLAGVGAEHMGELGAVLQRIVHRLGDELPHVGHLFDGEVFAFAGDVGVVGLPSLEVGALDGTGETGTRGRGGFSAFGHHRLGQAAERHGGCKDIALDDASVRAGAGDLRRIDALLGRGLTGARRNRCTGNDVRSRGGGGYSLSNLCHPRHHKRGDRLRSRRWGRSVSGGGCRGSTLRCPCSSRIARCELGGGLTLGADDHHVGQDGDLIAILEEAGEDGTRDLGFFLEGGLVCLIAE